MVIKVLSFGSNWWSRSADASQSREMLAYYNSTGLECGSTVRRHWVVSGLLRFNAVSNFNPVRYKRALGGSFLCSELEWAFGGNRVLFRSRLPDSAEPDCYLITISSALYGAADLTSRLWRSALTRVIAASQLRDRQQIMLLMKPGDWIETDQGLWQLHAVARRCLAELVLVAPAVPLRG